MGNIINESGEISNSDESRERNKKEQEYLEYIADHVGNVQKAYQLLFVPLLENPNINLENISDQILKDAIAVVGKNIIIHDESKYSDEEFVPYREKYFQTTKESQMGEEYQKIIEERLEVAWKHHYSVNTHHPAYWVDDQGNKVDMSLEAIIEMICDWEAMSIKFGSNTLEWYNTQADKEKEAMTEKTKEILENLFKIIY